MGLLSSKTMPFLHIEIPASEGHGIEKFPLGTNGRKQ
jgi:hypothetical protein